MKVYEVLKLRAKPEGNIYHLARVRPLYADMEEWRVYKNGYLLFAGLYTLENAKSALRNTLSRGGKKPPALDFVATDRKDIDKCKRLVFN